MEESRETSQHVSQILKTKNKSDKGNKENKLREVVSNFQESGDRSKIQLFSYLLQKTLLVNCFQKLYSKVPASFYFSKKYESSKSAKTYLICIISTGLSVYLHGKLSPRLTGLPYLADRATRLGGSPHLSCKRDQDKVRNYMDRRVTSPTWGPPGDNLPCKRLKVG